MSKKRWFRFYIERWRDGTFGLSPNEIAAFVTCLCELYEHDGIVVRPNFDLMARRCGMRPSSFRKAVDALIERRKLSLEGDVLTSKAVSEEVKSREKLDEKSAESRKNLAEKRNDFNEVQRKIPSNIREQNTDKIILEGSALPQMPRTGSGGAKAASVENFMKRRELFRRKGAA